MKKKIFILVLGGVSPFLLHAQLGSLINKAKNKIKDRVDRKVDNAMEKGLDKAEGKGSTATGGTETAANDQGKADKAKTTVVSYSKYDFVPGEKIIYSDDMAQDNLGELPVNWNTRGKGEVVTLDKFPGKWLRLFPGNTYLTGNDKAFGENYTVEFDVLMDGTIPKGTRFLPGFKFGLFASGTRKVTDNGLFTESVYLDKNLLKVSAKPNADAISKIELMTREQGKNTFASDDQVFATYSNSFYKVAHYAIQVQKQRFRFWVNEQKVFDVPRAVNLTVPLNDLFFSVDEYWFYNDDNYGLYISNIKVAAGVADSRHKLIDEGKFSTTGILFDLQSAVVRPESHGVINEIAGLLKETADLKIKIVGHTSSDGNAAANLELSKQRAAAVKEILVKEYRIDAARIETEGKGQSQPVADNKTKEGKAQNRRVEFIKL